MYWIQDLQNAIYFIEERLLEDISIEEIAGRANSSSSNFQRIFSIVTGMTIGDYIRCRRLSLAGRELVESDVKVMNVALKYGYETAESFTKAFTRFHDVTPSAAKRQAGNLKSFSPLSIKIDVKGGFNMQRKLIPNVPLLTWDGNNAAYFVNILDAVLQGLGETWDKAQLTAYSGEGNRFCWTDGKWVFGNELMDCFNETPFEVESRLLTDLGWRARFFGIQRNKDGNILNTDTAQIRRDFVDAIDRGIPVMPRWDLDQNSYNVFFGYEDDGQKMIGWDYEHNNSEPFAWENWERKLTGYILLREKTELRPEKEVVLDLFQRIVSRARRTNEIRGRKVGFAAWESFLRHLEMDDFSACKLKASEDTPPGHEAVNIEHRFIIYCDALCQIYARKGPLPYYQALAERYPEWRDELTAAVEALDACASYGGYLWSQGFSFDDAGYRKFKSPEGRKILADAGREAMHRDMEAVERFEKILQRSRR